VDVRVSATRSVLDISNMSRYPSSRAAVRAYDDVEVYQANLGLAGAVLKRAETLGETPAPAASRSPAPRWNSPMSGSAGRTERDS